MFVPTVGLWLEARRAIEARAAPLPEETLGLPVSARRRLAVERQTRLLLTAAFAVVAIAGDLIRLHGPAGKMG